MSARQNRFAAIARFTRMTYYGTYGIRWTFDIPGMLKAGLLKEEMEGARKLSAYLKRSKK